MVNFGEWKQATKSRKVLHFFLFSSLLLNILTMYMYFLHNDENQLIKISELLALIQKHTIQSWKRSQRKFKSRYTIEWEEKQIH